MKKAIAMKCNQEQFDKIRSKLEKIGLKVVKPKGHRVYLYLTNNHLSVDGLIGMTNDNKKREIHETWNEKIFLEACGIEVEETFTITKEQILTFIEWGNPDNAKMVREEWFPSVFQEEKKELVLEVGKWYKDKNFGKFMFCFNGKIEYYSQYGFNYNGDWSEQLGIREDKISEYTESTPQEIQQALEAEAVKRGFIEGNFAIEPGNCFMYSNKERLLRGRIEMYQGDMSMSGTPSLIYKKGVWGTVIKIKEMTHSEIENELGYKIKIVQ